MINYDKDVTGPLPDINQNNAKMSATFHSQLNMRKANLSPREESEQSSEAEESEYDSEDDSPRLSQHGFKISPNSATTPGKSFGLLKGNVTHKTQLSMTSRQPGF